MKNLVIIFRFFIILFFFQFNNKIINNLFRFGGKLIIDFHNIQLLL